MEIQATQTVSPPNDDRAYTVKILDFGHGVPQLEIAPAQADSTTYTLTVTDHQLQECQWRDTDKPLPTPVLRAIEFYGYHVTDVNSQPKHGLYENVEYLRESVASIEATIHEEDTLSRAALDWSTQSLDLLAKLELLHAHVTDTEYAIVLFKAQMTSKDLPPGLLSAPTGDGERTTASLRSMVLLMLAYAQHDGYLSQGILNPDTVGQLVMEPDNA